MDPNFQKSHYFLDTERCKRRKRNIVLGPEDGELHGTVFRKLLQESDEHVKHRFQLYEKVWSHQRNTIEAILGSANNVLFNDLVTFIRQQLSEKLDCAFLSMSSNTANNLRILDEFSAHVERTSAFDNAHIRLVRLSSKVCFNAKVAIKEVVKQILKGHKERSGEGKISYDFEIVEEWVQSYVRKHDCADQLRLVIVLDDADSFLNDVVNLLLQLFGVYSLKCPIKVVMGLITRNVSKWINGNITSKLRNLILGVRLEAKDNKYIGFRVIDEILLQNVITEQNPLLVSSHLSLIILNRFENSNNSIDSLITELKLSFMTYFYQLHLSAMLDPKFEPQSFHYDALRKLPSFKTHIEYFLQQLVETGETRHKTYIKDLLSDNHKLKALFEEAKIRFQNYQNTVMNAVHIIHWLCKGEKAKFEIYKLTTNNQFINSPFLTELLRSLNSFEQKQCLQFQEFLEEASILPDLKTCSDSDVKRLKQSIALEPFRILEYVTQYLHENKSLNMKISDNLFNEVLTITGGSSELEEQAPMCSIEENFDNLMINLIRPKQREILEKALEEPQFYLRNPLVLQEIGGSEPPSRLLNPSLSQLYQIYNDAPVNINFWDFYSAFKQSLLKRDVINDIETNFKETDGNPQLADLIEQLKTSDEAWDKMTFAWFIQSCFELNSMGFIREKSKGDYVEKMIWRNL
ncbi:hypothetical protein METBISCDRAFT_19805 [Metschnikowia bicuspidata]|uniref:Uncharacterized protein n=1 Tax=Metschnikowia bicuspidata TaxID=27322 RepID=A0A4P9Z8U1_9ASCO|nr:hypothetical protein METBISCDRAFT_19805 [Metschnikowia bicuspidata]